MSQEVFPSPSGFDAQSFFDEIAIEYQVKVFRHSSQFNIPHQNSGPRF